VALQTTQIDDDVVPRDLLAEVRNVIGGLGFRYGWRSNVDLKDSFGHWNFQILQADRNSTEDQSHALALLPAPLTVFAQFWEWLRAAKYPGAALLRCYANQHTYGTGGFPHTDADRPGEFTTVLYVNSEWRREWGGPTLIWDEEGEEIDRAVLPRPGRLLTFLGTRFHMATEPTRICPVARTVLVYKVRPL
jgi:SM-20-related protein